MVTGWEGEYLWYKFWWWQAGRESTCGISSGGGRLGAGSPCGMLPKSLITLKGDLCIVIYTRLHFVTYVVYKGAVFRGIQPA